MTKSEGTICITVPTANSGERVPLFLVIYAHGLTSYLTPY